MRLSHFILNNLEPILQEWENFARTVDAPAQALDSQGLRNHAEYVLKAVARDMDTPQTVQEGIDKSQGLGPVSEAETAAQTHAVLRLIDGYSLDQMVSEYRALRSSVLRLWLAKEFAGDEHHVRDIIRFNESIDQALGESIAAFGHAADTTRKMFLGVLGHDLRTPLAAVMMGADLLRQDQDLSGRPQKLAVQIAASVRRANQIVNDLLDLARCNLGSGIPIKPQTTDLEAVCKSVVEEVSACHPQAKIVFGDSSPVPGAFDPLRMGQVITNLVNNAVQHGESGREIQITLGKNAEHACVTVLNFGEPIPPNALPFLFNPQGRFSRFAASEEGASAGLGLGLFIAAEIVKSHGGNIEVESTLEQGTRFRVTLPLGLVP